MKNKKLLLEIESAELEHQVKDGLVKMERDTTGMRKPQVGMKLIKIKEQ